MMRTRLVTAVTAASIAAFAGVAMAGPPLLCHPFEIGTARSLPWDGSNGWMGRAEAGNLKTLVADTQALLTSDTPVIVRMETLRRAALYASRDRAVATELMERIRARAAEDAASGRPANPLATFDAGYLIETYREIGRTGARGHDGLKAHAEMTALVSGLDGYAMVQKSLDARAGDPSIEFASALIAASTTGNKGSYEQHAQKARAGAAKDALLTRNLDHISSE